MIFNIFILALILQCSSAFSFKAINGISKVNRALKMNSDNKFVKFHGLGNDFVIVDNTKSKNPKYTPEQSVKICDRNFGVGADGVIFALPGENGCDYTMRIYNSDGSEPQMCGNGIRCMAKYLQELENRVNTESVYKIWTKAGVIIPKVSTSGSITVDMGEPRLIPHLIPTTLSATKDGKVIEAEIIGLGTSYKTTTVSMGNPHSVNLLLLHFLFKPLLLFFSFSFHLFFQIIFVENLEKMNPTFSQIGPVMENHPVFPERVNAEFVEVNSFDFFKIIFYNRII